MAGKMLDKAKMMARSLRESPTPTVLSREAQVAGEGGDQGAVAVGDVKVDLAKLRKDMKIQSVRDQMRTEREATLAVREMSVYFLFAWAFTFTTLINRNDQEIFFFAESVRNQLTEVEFPNHFVPNTAKTFMDIATVEEFYQYLEGPFYSAVYTASTFDGDQTYQTAPADSNLVPNRRGWIMGPNRVIGGVRVGWSRVTEIPCSTPENVVVDDADNWLQCTPTYIAALPDSFDVDAVGFPTTIAGQHSIDSVLSEPEVTSPTTSNVFYAPKQFIVLPNREDTNGTVLAMIKEITGNKFVDRNFRSVVIDLTVYNANLDYYSVIRLTLETPVAGGVIPTTKFTTSRFYRHYVTSDWLRFGAEIFVMLIVLRYTQQVFQAMRRDGIARHVGLSSLPHNLNLLLFYMATGYKIAAYVTKPATVNPSADEFINFRSTASYSELAQDCNAFNAFLTWVKVTRYLSFIPKFKILIGTLSEAATELWAFFIITVFVLFGSSQAFSLAFGTSVYGHRNLTQAFFTLCRKMLGDFDFEQLRVNKPFLGPFMFIAFVMLAVFVLLNMFIAIIGDAFSDTKASLEEPAAKARADQMLKAVVNVGLTTAFRIPRLGDFLHDRVNTVGNGLKDAKHTNIHDLFLLFDRNMYLSGWEVYISKLLQQVEQEEKVTQDDICEALVQMGATDEEGARFARRVDRDNNGEVTTKELDEILEQWEKVVRARPAARLKKATSAANMMASRRVVPYKESLEEDKDDIEGGVPVSDDGVPLEGEAEEEEQAQARVFVHALGVTGSFQDDGDVGSTLDATVPETDPVTLRKAFNHLRLFVLIRLWVASALNGSEDPDKRLWRQVQHNEKIAGAADRQKDFFDREASSAEQSQRIVEEMRSLKQENSKLHDDVAELKTMLTEVLHSMQRTR